jgi:two-component system response regulator YesN
MIVDDEFLVHIGIKSMVDWEAQGYSIVYDANHGQDAIDKIPETDPHIILTDLVMEPVNGLELIKYCAERYPHIKIIVLSNYNDFEKVKSAMKLGASDFIFKLTINADELLNVINSVSKEIDERTTSVKEAERLLRRSAGPIREWLVHTLIEQSYINEEEFLNELKMINVACDFNSPYALLYLSIANYNTMQMTENALEPSLFTASLENIVSEIMTEGFVSQTFRYDNGQCLVVINLPGKKLDRPTVEKIKDSFQRIVECVERYFGLKVLGSLSRKAIGLEAFSHAVNECKKTMEERFFVKSPQLLVSHEDAFRVQELMMPLELGIAEWKIALDPFSFYDAEAFIRKVFDHLYQQLQAEPHLIREKLYDYYRVLKSSGLSQGILLDKLTDNFGMTLYQAIFQYDLLSTIEESFTEILKSFGEECDKLGNRKLKKETAQIIAYVKNNLSGNLSISHVARIIHISESYFSHLFKKEMGITFVDYVNRLRIEKAMAMLSESDKKINEIAYEVGINNPNYFSILFKKITNLSPQDYRNKKIAEK